MSVYRRSVYVLESGNSGQEHRSHPRDIESMVWIGASMTNYALLLGTITCITGSIMNGVFHAGYTESVMVICTGIICTAIGLSSERDKDA
jgi:hypothetical protein